MNVDYYRLCLSQPWYWLQKNHTCSIEMLHTSILQVKNCSNTPQFELVTCSRIPGILHLCLCDVWNRQVCVISSGRRQVHCFQLNQSPSHINEVPLSAKVCKSPTHLKDFACCIQIQDFLSATEQDDTASSKGNNEAKRYNEETGHGAIRKTRWEGEHKETNE